MGRNLVAGDISWRYDQNNYNASCYIKTKYLKTNLTEIIDIHDHEPETEENSILLNVLSRHKRKTC